MRISLICGIILLCSAQVFAEKTAHIIYQDDSGEYFLQTEGLPNPGNNPLLDDPSVLWSHYVEWPIYTSTSTSFPGYTFAGTYLNDPREAELFAPQGGGTPEWVYTGTEFRVDGSDSGSILGGADEHAGGVNVYKWTGPGNGVPDWTMNIPGVIMSSYGPYFEVSTDGSTLAALVYNTTDSRLLMFDPNSSTPIVDYTAAGFGFPRCMQLSANGRYAVLRLLTDVIVYDRDINSPRQILNIGYSTTPVDISGDGDLIAYGWTSMNVLHWTGSTYAPIWTASQPGYSLSKVSISEDASTLATGWYNSSFTTVRLAIYDSNSSTPIWTYNYPVSSGAVQEYISDIEVSADGRYIIVGSYGDNANINPEVHIFDRDGGAAPIFTVDMPGSVFSVDICSNGGYASACGKHVHANTTGHGGDVCAIDLDLTAPNVDIILTPGNPPIQIPANGGIFDFNIAVENFGIVTEIVDIWTMATLPSGAEIGPIINVQDFTMAAGFTGDRDRNQVVPATAPAGVYTYHGYVGSYPRVIYAEDEFNFEKLAVSDGGCLVTEWGNYGKSFGNSKIADIQLPEEHNMLSASPNPFNQQTTISFKLQATSYTELKIYDITGREVTTLVNGQSSPGQHSVVWDAEGVGSGVYFVRLAVDSGQSMVRKIVLMK